MHLPPSPRSTTVRSRSYVPLALLTLSTLFVGGVVALVVLYNDVVVATQEVRQANARILEHEAENVERSAVLRDQLSSESLRMLAQARGLVEEHTPQYLEGTSPQWAFASQH